MRIEFGDDVGPDTLRDLLQDLEGCTVTVASPVLDQPWTGVMDEVATEGIYLQVGDETERVGFEWVDIEQLTIH